jgi:hypothetical protein
LRFRRGCRALALVSLALVLSPRAFAQAVDDSTRNAARSLASQGKEAFDKSDYERARDLFHRAYTLVPAPTIVLYEGRALAKLQRLVEAEEAYIRAARTELAGDSPEAFRVAVADAESDLVALRARMPKVTIMPSGSGARDPELSVTLDGHPLKSALLGVEMPIDPGEHSVAATVPGGKPAQVLFIIAEKQQMRIDLPIAPGEDPAPMLAPEPPAPAASVSMDTTPAPTGGMLSTWQAKAGLVAGGVGLAGLTTGIVTGLMAGSRYADAESGCPQHACVDGSAGADALDSFRTLRTVSTIGYIVGGVGLAAGTTLFLIAPSKSSTTARSRAVRVWVGASSVGVSGAF